MLVQNTKVEKVENENEKEANDRKMSRFLSMSRSAKPSNITVAQISYYTQNMWNLYFILSMSTQFSFFIPPEIITGQNALIYTLN